MKTIEGTIAYIDNSNEFFTDKALQELSKTAKGSPVNVNFEESNIVGKVESSKIEDGKLIVKIRVDIPISKKPLFFAPSGYKYKSKFYLGSVGIVTDPCQKGLTQINSLHFNEIHSRST